MSNALQNVQLERYQGHIHEIQDDLFLVSASRLEGSLKDMFEKGEQSVHVPSVSWADAFAGAFVSALISFISFFFSTDRNLLAIAINAICPILSFLGMVFFRQKRISASLKQHPSTAIRDKCVDSQIRSLRKQSRHP